METLKKYELPAQDQDVVTAAPGFSANQKGWPLVDGAVGVEIVDGKICLTLDKLVFSNPNFGTLLIGQRPEGYPGWLFRENGGGGAVTFPVIEPMPFQFYIGLVKENRPNLGGEVWSAPGGFLNPKETHFKAASREAEEELGLSNLESRIVDLGSAPMACNRAFSVLRDDGLKFYSMKFEMNEVECDTKDRGPTGLPRFRFRQSLFDKVEAVSGPAKKIKACKFFHFSEVKTISPDIFAETGVGLLLEQKYRQLQQEYWGFAKSFGSDEMLKSLNQRLKEFGVTA
jgi:8-oxo-dGTP pyrophosphatase MutT (NUDIX family)